MDEQMNIKPGTPKEQKPRKHHSVKMKTPKHYRLSFYNENTLNLVWSIKMGRKRVIIFTSLAIMAVVCLGAMLISFTPLRTLLPGYLKNAERREYLAASEMLDSLINAQNVNNFYLNNVHDVLLDRVDIDTLHARAAMIASDPASVLPTSTEEEAFVRAYREREGFSLADRINVAAEAPAFVRPIRDAQVNVTGRTATFKVDGDRATVYAIARSTVLDTHSDGDGSYVIILQHPDGYVSRYSGLKEVYFDRGQSVGSGARLGDYDATSGQPLTFELLRDGTSLIPTDYIAF